MINNKDKVSNVISFKEAQLRSYAKTFVETYENKGKRASVEYAEKHIGRENYNILRKYIREIFISKGYKIHKVLK